MHKDTLSTVLLFCMASNGYFTLLLLCSSVTAMWLRGRTRICHSKAIALGPQAVRPVWKQNFKMKSVFHISVYSTSCLLSPLQGLYGLSLKYPCKLSHAQKKSVHIPVSKCYMLGNYSNLVNWADVNVLNSTSLDSPWDNIYSLKRKASGIMKEETLEIRMKRLKACLWR